MKMMHRSQYVSQLLHVVLHSTSGFERQPCRLYVCLAVAHWEYEMFSTFTFWRPSRR